MAQTGFGCSSCVQRTGESHTHTICSVNQSAWFSFPPVGCIIVQLFSCVFVSVLECVALLLNFFS